MRISHLKEVIAAMTGARLPVFAWSAPGIGKSSAFRQVARDLECELLVYIASIHDPVDLSGVPDVRVEHYDQDGKTVSRSFTHWNTPAMFPRSGRGIWLWDDLSNANTMMQSGIMQLTLERRLGEYVVPDGWVLHAAGNRVQDRSGCNKLITALANRFGCHADVEVSVEDWNDWAIENDIHPSIRSAIAWKRDLLHNFDHSSGELAFASPRSWEFADKIIKSSLPDYLLLETLSGCIGKAAAAMYVAHRKLFLELPNMDDIIGNPLTHPVPKEPSVLYALCGSLSDKAKGADHKQLTAIVQYGNRLPKDMATMLFLDCMKINQSINQVKQLIEWCKANAFLFAT